MLPALNLKKNHLTFVMGYSFGAPVDVALAAAAPIVYGTKHSMLVLWVSMLKIKYKNIEM